MQTWAGCLLACLPLHQKSQSLSSKKRASKSCSSLYYLIISKLKPITHRLLPAPSAPTGKLAHLHRAKSQVRNGCAHSYMHMCAHTHKHSLTHTHMRARLVPSPLNIRNRFWQLLFLLFLFVGPKPCGHRRAFSGHGLGLQGWGGVNQDGRESARAREGFARHRHVFSRHGHGLQYKGSKRAVKGRTWPAV